LVVADFSLRKLFCSSKPWFAKNVIYPECEGAGEITRNATTWLL